MKLKQVTASIVAGAVAASTMAAVVSAETVSMEKVLFSNDLNVGTVKFEASLNLGNYNVSSSSGAGRIALSIPKSVSVDYPDAPGLPAMDLFIVAKTFEVNGVKPYGDAPNNLLIKNPTGLEIATGLFDEQVKSGGKGGSTSSVMNGHEMQIAASTANKITIKGTFATGLDTLNDDQIDLLTYADKLRIATPTGSDLSIKISNIDLYRIDNSGATVYLEANNGHPYRNEPDISLKMNNVATFDGFDTTQQSLLEAQAFTLLEKEAIRTDGADIKLVVEMANKPIGSAALSYVKLEIEDKVRSSATNPIWGRPVIAMLDGTTATFNLTRDQVYQEAYDEFNSSYRITATNDQTSTVNNYIKAAKIVVTYDDGVIAEAEDVADSEDEPEPEIEDDDFVDEAPEAEDEDFEDEDFADEDFEDEDFADEDFEDEDDFLADDEDDFAADEATDEADEDTTETATTADANPGTGVGLALIPALLAGAGAVIARKRK